MTPQRPGRPPDKVRSIRLRLGDLNIKPGQDPRIDALCEELQSLSRQGLKGRTVLTRLLTGQAMAQQVTAETSGEEVQRLVREAEAAAAAFFDRFGDETS